VLYFTLFFSVRILLQQGTSPDACNDDGLTALHQVKPIAVSLRSRG